MTILDKFLEIAEKEIGVKEGENASRIIEYNAYTELDAQNDEIPWCSSFANFVVAQAGLVGTKSAAAKSWLKWGKELQDPIPGCIVVMNRGKNPALGHVGFYVKTENDGLIVICGGNQHNEVNISNFFPNSILSYRAPNAFLKEVIY
jgi:uncharacterized protein (TIGR02594 family)